MISRDEFEDIIEGDNYVEVVEEAPYCQSRWSTWYSAVYLNKETDLFYQLDWSRGSTEMQDEGPEDITIREVKPVQKTITVYE